MIGISIVFVTILTPANNKSNIIHKQKRKKLTSSSDSSEVRSPSLVCIGSFGPSGPCHYPCNLSHLGMPGLLWPRGSKLGRVGPRARLGGTRCSRHQPSSDAPREASGPKAPEPRLETQTRPLLRSVCQHADFPAISVCCIFIFLTRSGIFS